MCVKRKRRSVQVLDLIRHQMRKVQNINFKLRSLDPMPRQVYAGPRVDPSSPQRHAGKKILRLVRTKRDDTLISTWCGRCPTSVGGFWGQIPHLGHIWDKPKCGCRIPYLKFMFSNVKFKNPNVKHKMSNLVSHSAVHITTLF